jgi:VIT1/CCC1 family predicted Fe2+/Mn2+ transporter
MQNMIQVLSSFDSIGDDLVSAIKLFFTQGDTGSGFAQKFLIRFLRLLGNVYLPVKTAIAMIFGAWITHEWSFEQ